MSDTTSTTIDSAGRVVIPKEIRDDAGLESGTKLRIRLRGGLIEMESEPREVRIEWRGPLQVAVPVDEAESLDRDAVSETRRRIRSDRGEDR